ncbi:MAG: hypothetical protein JWM40_127 [Frankiales bacterium]|nr:hypothetical protein [Frankiales bacterium]
MTLDPGEHQERLRAAVLALKTPQAAKRAPAPTSSVFGRTAAAVPDDVRPRASREALAARFRNVETSALMSGTTMVLLVHPDPGGLPAPLMRSMELLVASKGIVVALGPDMPREIDRGRPLTLPLRTDDALASEWAMLALGPAKRVAFLARRVDDGWDWMITRDQVAVHRAGTAILERVPFLRLRVPALQD